ncbi:precorrin-2 dehydrogenase/sirohydrochlorin ferrochelatase family protein [Thermohalobacter berrensis]|uniref:precorrin-2 dehydrogenase n=1 Tax=Thermohalobacter berrensis TaxID=99594 RepID=A0A419SZN2_9FIRM|nr:bifunctional precorrin-2 dehydrogenase/sirohydrochlorin ferrochelatase [Thermohalobacter berrensis]RKD30621.1 siroheme synthase [Thermohalobacter berrensis]
MFYPMMINVKNKKVSVVGGGRVAYRKVKTFLKYGADVKVISINFINKFEKIKDKIEIIKDKYTPEYIKNSFLVVAATSSKETNEKIALFCKENKILCNIADDIQLSDFIVPSSIKKGDLIVSVSTSGKSPLLARKIRKEIEEIFPYEYDDYVNTLGETRRLVIEKCKDEKRKNKLLNELIDLDLEELKKRREKYEDCSRL